MLPLKNHIDGLNLSIATPEMEHLATKAVASVAFGERVVTLEGYSGSVSLNYLAIKVIADVQEQRKAPRMIDSNGIETDISSMAALKKVHEFYAKTDALIQESDLAIQILRYIKKPLSLFNQRRIGIEALCKSIRGQMDETKLTFLSVNEHCYYIDQENLPRVNGSEVFHNTLTLKIDEEKPKKPTDPISLWNKVMSELDDYFINKQESISL